MAKPLYEAPMSDEDKAFSERLTILWDGYGLTTEERLVEALRNLDYMEYVVESLQKSGE